MPGDAIRHPSVLEDWSEHLTKAGVYDVEYLIDTYADDNGMIRAADLPRRTIRYDPPQRGAQTPLNQSGGWVSVDAPPPKKFVIPDLSEMTSHEIGGILNQARDLGYIVEKPLITDVAKVENG